MRTFKRALHIGYRTITVFVFGLLLGSTVLFGQSTSGSIIGTVKDNAGALVPDATVTVANPAINLKRTASSNSEGGFVFAQLPPGNYTVTSREKRLQTVGEKWRRLERHRAPQCRRLYAGDRVTSVRSLQ